MNSIRASILIPTLKRPASLVKALESVLAQDAPFPFEVIVLDNGCEPETRDLVVGAKAGAKSPRPRYIPVQAIGLHNARHAGARAAQGEVLIYIDDDIIAAPGWLQAIVSGFDDPCVHLSGGPSLPQFEGQPPDWLEAFWPAQTGKPRVCTFLSLLDMGPHTGVKGLSHRTRGVNPAPIQIDPNLVWGLNFAIRKQTLFELGGFHPDSLPWELRRYRGDGETAVTTAIKQLGYLAIYHPAARVSHVIPGDRLTLAYLQRRNYLDGISASFASLRLAEILARQQRNEPLAHLRPKAFPTVKSLKITVKSILLKILPRMAASAKAKSLATQAFQAGYDYHQNEVRGDADLLRWVLREDYWDAVLPDFAQE